MFYNKCICSGALAVGRLKDVAMVNDDVREVYGMNMEVMRGCMRQRLLTYVVGRSMDANSVHQHAASAVGSDHPYAEKMWEELARHMLMFIGGDPSWSIKSLVLRLARGEVRQDETNQVVRHIVDTADELDS